MSLDSVKKHLKEYNLEKNIIHDDNSTATVEEAAIALGCRPKDIAKTMAFDVDGKTIVIVVAGDKKIDNSKYKGYFHKKAKMLAAEEVEPRTSHLLGGVCPFGLPDNVEVYLDKSLKEFEFVYPAAGTPHDAVKITIEDLEKVTNHPEWIDVVKD